jgi:energy-coupling factor transporter ATP-binding protein EcfA2
VLELQGLTRRYGDLVALDDLSFTVAEGQMFGFVGPNGAGKTTAMRIVLGVLEPDAGQVLWRGSRSTSRPAGAPGTCQRTTAKRFLRQFAVYRSEPADRGDGWWRDVLAPAEWAAVTGWMRSYCPWCSWSLPPEGTGQRACWRGWACGPSAAQPVTALLARRQQRCDL